MRANESYRNDYVNFMTNLMEKGYCERVPRNSSEETSNVWYLPHHGVYHPQKGKLRIVFDCSAKFNGACLNDLLLQGPNLANNLCGILKRFRFDRIAFVADLEAMFYQVQVPVCIVEAVEMDDQNLVRSVTIRSEGKSLRWPIHKLIFLCSSD